MRFADCKRMQASAAGLLIIPLVLCMGASVTGAAQQPGSGQQQPSIPAQPSDNPPSSTSAAQGQSDTPGAAQPAAGAQQGGTTSPVGTAAAPKQQVTGVMGSRPAGAAIAPARQRRARTILIRVGVVIGAAVAVGTVAALSKGSPSRPN